MSNVVALSPRPGDRNDRAPIRDIGTEAAVLGAILVNPDAYYLVSGVLKPEHFAEEVHRKVFTAAERIASAGETPTYRAIKAAFGETATQADLAPGHTLGSYIAGLAADASSVSQAPEYARLVRTYWALREIESAAMKASDGSGYVASALLSETLDRIDDIRASLHDHDRKSTSAGNAAAELVGQIEQRMLGESPATPSTGLLSLDRRIGGGLRPGKVIVVAARTSMGKSIMACEIAERVAHQGFASIYHTLEMGADEVSARTISSRLERRGIKVAYERILAVRDLDDVSGEIVAEARALKGLPLQIEHAGGVTIAEIKATSERRLNAMAKRGIKPGAIVIDHAHLVKAGRHYQREDERIREVTNGAVALGKHLDCAVVLLAQLNRQTEGRDDKRPGPADLRGSGSLEEDADTVIFLYRAAYYAERTAGYRSGNPDAQAEFTRVKNDLELIVDKNRQGKSNQVVQAWIDPALNAIRDKG